MIDSLPALGVVGEAIRGHGLMNCNTKKKWFLLLATGGVMFQLAGCLGEAIFLVAPFIV